VFGIRGGRGRPARVDSGAALEKGGRAHVGVKQGGGPRSRRDHVRPALGAVVIERGAAPAPKAARGGRVQAHQNPGQERHVRGREAALEIPAPDESPRAMQTSAEEEGSAWIGRTFFL